MGEMAEDRIDGTMCSLCGSYFQDPTDPDALFTHGEPVVCKDCWKDLSSEDKELFKKAIADTL